MRDVPSIHFLDLVDQIEERPSAKFRQRVLVHARLIHVLQLRQREDIGL